MADQLTAEVVAVLNERAADAAARRLETRFAAAGRVSGEQFQKAFESEVSRSNLGADAVGRALQDRMARHGTQAAGGFGSAFGTQLAQSLPGISGFASAMSGYEGAAGKMGAVAGRALGLAFTTAAAGVIGAAGYTIFKGFERYEAIDAAKNRLDNLNRTLESTGKAGIDVGAVMKTVNDVVLDTPFALDKAFSIATRALASNTGDLKRFMTDVADAAGFAGEPIQQIGEAFLKVSNQGKVSMEELTNELQNIPIASWLQETLGKTGPEITKMIHDNKVGLEDLLKTVEQHAGGFAKAAGDTVQGAMENVQTSIARLGANFLGAIFGKPIEDGNQLVDVLKTLRARIDEVGAWVTAHQDDIRRFFQEGKEAAADVVGTVGSVVDALDKVPGGIRTVTEMFAVWETLKFTGLIGSLSQIGSVMPKAGSVLAILAGIELARPTLEDFADKHMPHPAGAPHGFVGLDASGGLSQPAQNGVLPGAPNTSSPPTVGGIPIPGLVAPNPVSPKGPLPTAGGPGGMPAIPGHGLHWEDGKGWVLDSTGAAPAGGPIQDPSGAGGSSGGLPKAPQIPYPAEYGQPPAPGETPEHWRARMGAIEAAHDVAEKRARVDQLEKDNTATQDDIVKANNALITAKMAQTTAEQQLSQQKAQDVQVPYGPGYGAPPRPGETAEQYSSEQSFLETQHKSAQARADLQSLEQSGTATTAQLTEANNKLIEAQGAENLAYLRLSEASKQTTTQLGDLGAALDPDLGISKGLAGMADNLVRFLGAIALAGPMAKLSAISAAHGDEGSGLMGYLASRGALGERFLPKDSPLRTSALPGGTPGTATTPGAATTPGTGYPGDAALLAGVPAGRYDASGDLSKGLGDCSSAVEDLVNLMDGRPTEGRSMATGNADQWLTEHGFVSGMGGPGDFRVGFNAGHMQATLPGGTPFNWGSDEAAARGGVGGTGADDPAFTSHYYRPGGGPGAARSAASLSGGGVIPVYVTNFDGAMSGGPPAGSPASGQGTGPAPGPGGLSPQQWNNIMGAEAGGSGGWSANTGNGFSGGLQFTPPSWAAAGGLRYAPEAWQATPEQQMAAGNNLLALQGPGAWPATSAAHPEWFQPGAPNIIPGSAGQGFLGLGGPGLSPAPGLGGPGIGSALGAGLGGPGIGGALGSNLGGQPYPAQAGGGGGGIGVSEGVMGAASLAASAIPGGGALAQMGMQLANRTIKFAGQAAAIGVEGLFQTVLPSGDNPKASIGNSWLGKFMGGIAGARPAVPNIAGGKNKQPPGPMTDPAGQGAQQGQPGNQVTNHLTVNNNHASEDMVGNQAVRELGAMYAPSGQQ